MGAITDDDDSICGLNNFHNLNNSKSGFNTLLQLARQSVRQTERDGWTDGQTDGQACGENENESVNHSREPV